MRKRKKGKKIAAAVCLLFAAALAAVLYVNDYYRSDESVMEYLGENGTTAVSTIANGVYIDGPGEEKAIIFYPGAKVEYTAYLPLFYELAEQGVDAFIVKMPCNLAIFGQNKAEEIMVDYEYEHWYLAGHSLGGAMAASWAAEHPKELEGLILLAAYPTKALTDTSFSVLSVYGSEDGVLNMEKLEAGRSFMPEEYTELCIEGGNHAGFGNYGKQKGDGEAAISAKEQQKQTAEAILWMIDKKEESHDL